MTTTDTDITVTITRSVGEALLDQAEILIHDDDIVPDVPHGVYYDTINDRWTWAFDEAVRWAIVSLAEAE